jgi:hypothetical protein
MALWSKKDDQTEFLRELDIPMDRNGAKTASRDEVPEYDLDTLLTGITPDNVHPETLTGPAVGNEFA